MCYVPPIGKSDHVCLVFNTSMYAQTKVNSKPRFTYYRGKLPKNTEFKTYKLEKKLEGIASENAQTRFEEALS